MGIHRFLGRTLASGANAARPWCRWGLSVWLAVGTAREAMAQHSHINAGARDAVAGAPLFIANAASFDVGSGFVVHLGLVSSPVYGPIYFGGGDVTFTSLAVTPDNGGPVRFAALPGAHLEAVLETLDGPAGGSLAFWDSDGFFDATEITFSVPVGTRDGTRRFVLSENDGSPGSDPYGHIHGRKFSVDVPGHYVLGLRLVDTGGNGPGGGPSHAPSEVTRFRFQAGVSIAELRVTGIGVSVGFATDPGRTYVVEAALGVGPGAVWTSVAGPYTGDGRMRFTEDLPAVAAPRFFRLRVD